MMMVMAFLLYPAGAFALAQGTVHFFLPALLDFQGATPAEGSRLKPFRHWLLRYAT